MTEPRWCLALLLFSLSAAAQQSAVERCREATSDAARIACLEAALLESSGGTPGSETPGVRDPGPGPDAAGARVEGSRAKEQPATAASPGNDIGAAQVRARRRTADDLETARGLEVESYRTVPYRRLEVGLANGQVWRQIEGDTQRIRVDLDRNRTVDIEESGLGGYKLRLNEIDRTIRVERVR